MAFATTDDGMRLHYEETGSGSAVIFVHEFAGDHRSWEPQMRHFGRRHRCVAFNARGYPPSDGRERLLAGTRGDNICSILDHLGEAKAYVVGLSMGGFATLHFGYRHPGRALALCVG